MMKQMRVPAAGTGQMMATDILDLREQQDVRLENVVKTFGAYVAVDNISLTIESGEFFSLLGPSGCGKSTTLAMIGGFDEPNSGAIYLGGTDVSHLPPYRRDVNTVFQSYALFPHLSVSENVAFGLRRKGVAKAEINNRVRDMLALVDLERFVDRKPAQLSGGQQQRVALARALVNRPKLLLLDEPLGALDLKLRKQMQLELKRIQAEIGITFLFVTHDQEEAMVMSDRLAVMAGGRIEQVGAPADVYDNPCSEFVAAFLGVSNLIPGVVTSRGADISWLKLADGTSIKIDSKKLRSSATEIKIGVRPEKFHILSTGDNAGPEWNVIEATVGEAVYLGVSHQYTVESRSGQSLSVYVQNLGNPMMQQGEVVRLAWYPEHTFVIEPS
ncbi:MAG: ABC transporter ATP-binding protein [Acidocella sp.]|nr:ABC transporter ATP-binding protein [Acidocella sp.]